MTKESLAEWFQQMKQYLDAMDPTLLTSPGRIFNDDESGFSICPKARKSATGQEPSMFTPSQTAHGSRWQCWPVPLLLGSTADLPLHQGPSLQCRAIQKKMLTLRENSK